MKNTNDKALAPVSYRQGKKRIPTIQAAFYGAGVTPHYHGYYYFVSAIELAIEEPHRLQNIRRDIYFPISKQYATNIFNVEKNIRTIRDALMRNGGRELLMEMSGSPIWFDRLPYPKEVIGIFAEYFRAAQKE